MAAPVTHLLFASALSDTVSNEFISGVSFPDIRYFGSISRDLTHAYGSEKITDTSSFISGMAFHQYLDEMRGRYWNNSGIYSKLPPTPLSAQALKFCEDIVLYDISNKWSSIASALRRTRQIPETFRSLLSDEEVRKWYELLVMYIEDKPNVDMIKFMLHTIGIDKTIANDIESRISTILSDETMLEAINQYYSDMVKDLRQKFVKL